MPKDAPVTPSKRAARSTSESPSKQPRKSPQKKKDVEPVDESQWRPSRIWAGKTINKTAALELYRLKKEHLNGLKPTTEEREIVVQGELKKVTTYIYPERAIELEAWRVHGGPEGFEEYLQKLRSTHQKKYPGKEFKCPSTYEPSYQGGAATVSIVSLPPLPPGADRYANTPTLVDLKNCTVTKAHGDRWLWDACNTHLRLEYSQFPNNTNHAKAIHAAIRDLPNYPPRSLPPAELSSSFQALESVLTGAPTRETLETLEGGNMVNIRVDEVPFPLETYYFWSQDYFTRVYKALIDIIRAHGVGAEGWEAARWVVYDKYRQWDGIKIHQEEKLFREMSYTAQDGAFGWLQGRLPNGEQPQLEFSTFIKDNHPPSIWAEYNNLLPATP